MIDSTARAVVGRRRLDGTPRAVALVAADHKQRVIAQTLLLPLVANSGGRIVVCHKGYAGREFDRHAADLGLTIVPPARKHEPPSPLQLTSLRQRIESVFATLKDILRLERHGARSHTGLRARIALRLLALSAAINLNHQLARPSRSLVAYTA